MNGAWVAVAAGVAVVIVLLVVSWLRRVQDFDRGTVSHQWIAEQRFGQGHDPQR